MPELVTKTLKPAETSKLVEMARQIHSGLLCALMFGALAVCSAASAQTNQSSPAPCTVIPQPDPCGTKPSEKKPAAEKFPFPGQTTSQPSSSAPTLTGIPRAADPSPAPPAPGASANATDKSTPDKKFPFPGETGGAASAEPGSGAGSSSSSSSSSSDEPSVGDAAPELKDKGSEGEQTKPSGRHLLHRVNPPGTKLQSPEEREAEDVDVAHFYMDRGDFNAAYLRGQDAVKLQPDDPEAHFVLAEVALKLNKTDEAVAHYRALLKLDPTDKQAKAAHKALERLQAQR